MAQVDKRRHFMVESAAMGRINGFSGFFFGFFFYFPRLLAEGTG